ncbi:hypothetical protein P0C28_11180 [Aeromonas hydrophila]|nr:hypothetical protein [Aeromonas hydrophila]MDE8809816.1 hypothetical protein [Aeromonas hydrophila]
MGIGQLLKDAIIKVKDSNMHPVTKGVIIVACFAGIGAATYFGVA